MLKLVAWEVEFTHEFERWWDKPSEIEHAKVDSRVRLLEQHGPNLGYPFSSAIRGSRFSEMRELRTQAHGDPLRVLYAFDSDGWLFCWWQATRPAMTWYETNVPIADRLFEIHLKTIEKESAGNG